MQAARQKKTYTIIEMAVVYSVLFLLTALTPAIMRTGHSNIVRMTMLVLISVILTGTALFAFYFHWQKGAVLGFSKINIASQILIGIVLFMITIIIAVILPLAAGIRTSDVLRFKNTSIYAMVFYLFYDIICVGFGEEIIFRGYFYSRIESISSVKCLPMVLSAILFGFLRLPNTFSVIDVTARIMLGLLYGFCRWKINDCSLLSLCIAHGLHDATIVLLSFVLL